MSSHVKRMFLRISRLGRREKWNVMLDEHVESLASDQLTEVSDVEVLDVSSEEYWTWLHRTSLDFRRVQYPHKKALEFFFSQRILAPSPNDSVLDAAGGRSGYLDAIRDTAACTNLYLTDHIYTGVKRRDDGVFIVGGDISAIELAPQSLSRISCHHAFEHFQGDRDSAFVREIARLLRPGGRACIIPLFVARRFVECWNMERTAKFDERASLLVDQTASLPGADDDGHFARVYDMESLQRRVLNVAAEGGLNAKIVICRLDGSDLPDMSRNFGARINHPLRALVLEKAG